MKIEGKQYRQWSNVNYKSMAQKIARDLRATKWVEKKNGKLYPAKSVRVLKTDDGWGVFYRI